MEIEGFFPKTVKGLYKSRPNRFIVECIVNNRTTRAYLPNPGRLWELFFPGVLLYLVKHEDSYERSTGYTVVAVERDGLPIMLHTHVNNLVARQLIEQGRISGLENTSAIKPEVRVGNSRFDFLLHQNDEEILVEIKSCTLVGEKIAMFPDAVTARGTKHLLELACLTKKGIKTAVVFLVHWPKAEYFLPEHHTDLVFAQTLLAVKNKILVKAVSVEWNSSLMLGRTKELIIPWQLVEQEAHDSGCYLIIMNLKKDLCLSVGDLGQVKFKEGYYVYAGSAKTSLTKRIERHRRLLKRYHWHIDFLRGAADFCVALPIRTSEDLECALAAALAKITDWEVVGFGSSDCNCKSHLFGMTENPIHSRPFIDLLLHFRINRLEKFVP
jgi:sugar fermentation stimulation protein A